MDSAMYEKKKPIGKTFSNKSSIINFIIQETDFYQTAVLRLTRHAR